MSYLKIYTDGGARGNPGLAACAFVAIKKGKIIFKDSKFLGICTNNEAEYEGVVLALKWLLKNKDIFSDNASTFYLDSELVTRQINGDYRVKSENLFPYKKTVNMLLKKIKMQVNFKSISREENRLSDALVNETIDEKNG